MKFLIAFAFALFATVAAAQTYTATEVADMVASGGHTATLAYSVSTKTYTVSATTATRPLNRLIAPLRFEDVEPVNGSAFNVAGTAYWQVESEQCSAPDGATWLALWLISYDRYGNELCRFGVDAGSLNTKGQMSAKIGGVTYRLCNQVPVETEK